MFVLCVNQGASGKNTDKHLIWNIVSVHLSSGQIYFNLFLSRLCGLFQCLVTDMFLVLPSFILKVFPRSVVSILSCLCLPSCSVRPPAPPGATHLLFVCDSDLHPFSVSIFLGFQKFPEVSRILSSCDALVLAVNVWFCCCLCCCGICCACAGMYCLAEALCLVCILFHPFHLVLKVFFIPTFSLTLVISLHSSLFPSVYFPIKQTFGTCNLLFIVVYYHR